MGLPTKCEMQEEGLTVLEVFDPNHDGVVFFDELRTVLSRFAIGLSYESIDALTKQLLGGKESLRTAELLELLDVLAAGAGAAIERDMAAALPPPPPLPATAFFRCHWRTDSRRRRRASATAFRRIFPLRGWSRAALTMASACRVLSAQRLCCSGEERLAFRKVATSFAASPRIRLASACAALTICVAASVASCNTFAAGVECHSSMELRSAWLGMSTLLGSCAPVLGLVLFVASQRSMLARS